MKTCCFTILTSFFLSAHGQDSLMNSSFDKSKFLLATGTSAALWTASYIGLNQAWYKDHARTSFHFFNDNKEWQQVDKAGHIWSSYQMSRLSAEMWKWTGMKKKNAIILGGATGIAYVSIMEIQDGYSDKWGFSWGDMLANVVGAASFVSQELFWKDQRLTIKMGYSPYNYPMELEPRRKQLFGRTLAERILKDYNAQRYWVSINLSSFTKSGLPKWLNMGLGYHAEGMVGGFENSWTDKNGVRYDYSNIPRTRSILISPDIDWTKIKSGRKVVRALLFVLNIVKCPGPALEFRKGGIKVHAIYF